jgi:hypothetical protein
MMRKVFGLSVTFVLVLAASCSDSKIGDYSAPPSVPVFDTPDSSADVELEAGLTSYCPSNKCPAGFTTCPSSRFPCDVNLKADRDNCGACGFACPVSDAVEVYECIDGRCVLQCGADLKQDCDGIVDNGCETVVRDDENCGACGNKCLDPAKPCVRRGVANDYGCGCIGNMVPCRGACKDVSFDDGNCGACGNACDRAGDGGPLPNNGYYGCIAGKCGGFKCAGGFGNCDGNTLNGCETSLATSENCGGCGVACAPGQECKLNLLTGKVECGCPEGETYCNLICFGSSCLGGCYDLATSKINCGGCGVGCDSQVDNLDAHINAQCRYGMCSSVCTEGYADCNRNPEDGCEVNTDRDPRNCGACGRTCDAVAGQACVRGQCVVEPCDQVQPDGGMTR